MRSAVSDGHRGGHTVGLTILNLPDTGLDVVEGHARDGVLEVVPIHGGQLLLCSLRQWQWLMEKGGMGERRSSLFALAVHSGGWCFSGGLLVQSEIGRHKDSVSVAGGHDGQGTACACSG